MSVIHDSNVWGLDQRTIAAAKLDGHPSARDGIFLCADGWAFERFERNGDMAPLPFLRLIHGDISIEAPLVQFGWVEFVERSNAE